MPGPPEPFDGLVSIAAFGSKTEADVALSALRSEGFDATLSFDPTLNSVATYFASDRTFELLVRTQDADAAVETLEHLTSGLPEEFSEAHAVDYRAAPRRRRARRVGLFLVLFWFGVPLLLFLMAELLSR